MVILRTTTPEKPRLMFESMLPTAMIFTKSHGASSVRLIRALLLGFFITLRVYLTYAVALFLQLFCHLDLMENSSSNVTTFCVCNRIHFSMGFGRISDYNIILLILWVTDYFSFLSLECLCEACTITFILLSRPISIIGIWIGTTAINFLHSKNFISERIFNDSVEFWELMFLIPIFFIIESVFSPSILIT